MLLNFEELIKKYDLKIHGIMHIGAHIGQEHKLYKKNKIENIIYFEPLSENFNNLKNNVNEEGTLFNCALGNQSGEIEMFVESANMGQSSSILEPALHTKQYPKIIFNKKETVKIEKLDNIPLDINKYNFINIDVQGYELEVFKGGEKTLEKIDYIITEVNREELYYGCPHVEDLDKFLDNFNFKRVETSWAGGTWGDALYIKKNV
jgi:FkbM family methyltransferase